MGEEVLRLANKRALFGVACTGVLMDLGGLLSNFVFPPPSLLHNCRFLFLLHILLVYFFS